MTDSGTALIDPYQIFGAIGLAEGMRVADFGCGRTGHFVFPTAKVVGDKGIVYAIDIMKDVLGNIDSRVKSENFENVKTVWADIEAQGKMPIPANSLDIALFVNVMFMIKDKPAAVAEAVRLLKTGGKLVVVDWVKKLGPLGPSDSLLVSPNEVMSIGQNLGLQPQDNVALSDYHFCLILSK